MKKPDNRDNWETPDPLFSWLDSRFSFNIDAAATKKNAKCSRYVTETENTLAKVFSSADRVFCNPPYSLDMEFAEYLYDAYQDHGTSSLLLLPVRCDRIWWNHLRTSPGVRIEYYTGRIHFSNAGKGAFMYNCNFIFGFPEVKTVDPIDAGQFNVGGKGSATT